MPDTAVPGIVDAAESTPAVADTYPVREVDTVPSDVKDVTAVLTRVPDVGKVTVVMPVVVKVKLFAPDKANATVFGIVKVPVEDVIVNPLIDVAVAAPKDGVVRDGDVARTTDPVPVIADI